MIKYCYSCGTAISYYKVAPVECPGCGTVYKVQIETEEQLVDNDE